jgi:hypothetical protein
MHCVYEQLTITELLVSKNCLLFSVRRVVTTRFDLNYNFEHRALYYFYSTSQEPK